MFQRYRIGYLVLVGLTALQLAVAIAFGTAEPINYLPGKGFLTKMLPAWATIPLAWAGWVSIEMARRQTPRPLMAVRRMFYRQRKWLLRGALFMLAVLYSAIGFTSFKTAIPIYVPFYADPWLAELDRAMFGADAWRITHLVLGEAATVIIDRIYFLWFMTMMIYVGWFCFSRNSVLQLRGLISYVLVWGVLGCGLALAGSSVGPCFYQHFYSDPQFDPLMAKLNAIDDDHGLFAVGSMNYLLNSIGKDRLGAGISAMPSIHVAVAFLCFLVSWTYARRWWVKLLAGLFFATIAVGSVHLGWHYASDGIVSVIATALIWWGSGRFVDWVEAREARAQLLPA